METFDKIIDFTRTTSGSYVDSDGKIKVTPASRNLLIYTQEFDNGAWTKNRANVYPFDPATAIYGPELVTNGTFGSDLSGWIVGTDQGQVTATWSAGAVVLTRGTGGTNGFLQNNVTVAGRFYKITMDVVSGSAAFGGGFAPLGGLVGSVTIYRQATGSTLMLWPNNPSSSCTIDNISVREVIGGLITAPDGTLTADALIEDVSASSTHSAMQNISISAGVSYAVSVYAKPAGRNWLGLQVGGAVMGSARTAYFNIATGTVGTVSSGITAGISPAGDGWYRCMIFFTAIATAVAAPAVLLANADNSPSYTGDGTSGIYLWGAQIEVGSTATDYTRNVGGLYPPRFDYDPVTLAPRGLLIEMQRTNLLLRSEEFENATWAKSIATITANYAASPDGTADADRFVSAGGSFPQIAQLVTVSTGDHTVSIYVKSDGTTQIQQTMIFDGASVNFTPTSTWTRVTLTKNVTVSGAKSVVIATNSASAAASSFLIWGAQLEAGAFPTSYIPTAASQVTRAADNAVITGANFSRWYNQTEGTFVVEAATTTGDVVNNSWAMAAQNAGTTSMIGFYIDSLGSYRLRVTNSGTNQVLLNAVGTAAADTTYRIAGAYKIDDFAVSANGGAAAADTSGSVPADLIALAVGSFGFSGGSSWNGHIRRIRYYPTRLSNAQLQALTA